MALIHATKCGVCETVPVNFGGSLDIKRNKSNSVRVQLGSVRRCHFMSIRARGVNENTSEVNEDTSEVIEKVEDGEKEKAPQKGKQKGPSFFSRVTDAFDAAQVRSQQDANLLESAREATRGGERMTREQYGALRRKIGGTYKDFFKDSVDVIGDYVDDGWVDKTCRYCKKDTSNDPRTKDSLGRYAHVACTEKAKSGNFFTRLFGK